MDPACTTETFKGMEVDDPLPGYFVEFAASPNVPRLHYQLAPSIRPLVLEEADFQRRQEVSFIEPDFQRWDEQGPIAPDHMLGGWNRNQARHAPIFLNHLNIWKNVANAPEEHQWTAVFEGDTVFRTDFHNVLADLRLELASGRLPPADVVTLGHCLNDDCASQHAVKSLSGRVTVVVSDMPVCSHAYLLSKRGAQILQEHALPIRDSSDSVPMLSLIK